ncbi:hypothetical protein [Mycobacterium sp.]|uniref:hypothetical protein n=1 Tax=Mycobacterium sp. TaxID=1785 RepID=UPI002CC8B9E5|nr:hypothetical protein [Mycobacterium sp.]HTY34509.1 hypothetical protein [Mycobacterium sp.]
MTEHIDLSKVSDAELENIHNDVLRNLATRLKNLEDEGGPTPIGPHDKHNSVHAKNTLLAEKEIKPE